MKWICGACGAELDRFWMDIDLPQCPECWQHDMIFPLDEKS